MFACGLVFTHMPGKGFAGRLIPASVHGRLDIGDLESGFVVAYRGASRSEIHYDACDTRQLANTLFHSVRAQCGHHAAHFNDARFHGGAFARAALAWEAQPRVLMARDLSGAILSAAARQISPNTHDSIRGSMRL